MSARLLIHGVLAAVLGLGLSAQETTRGLETRARELGGEHAVVGRHFAVLIAVDRYRHWFPLRNPVKDAREIGEILRRRYHVDEVRELLDEEATKAGIIRLFGQLVETARPEDSVLVFYAGHGYLDPLSNTGFWIPVDGGTDKYAQENWIPNAQLRGLVGRMKARHVALISDSCFSGDILNPTRGAVSEITNEYFRRAYQRVSRQVLTSGASEAVPDASSFAQQLKLALEGNTQPYLDPLMLYNEIRLGVTDTTPMLGALKESGHQEGGSYLLFLKQTPIAKEAAGRTTKARGVGLVLGGGRGDRSYSDSAYDGLVMVAREFQGYIKDDPDRVDFGRKVELKYLTPKMDGSDREQLLRVLAEDGYGLVFGMGFAFAAPIEKVAKDFPGTHFALVDAIIPKLTPQSNLTCLSFAEHEGSFLIGSLVGLMVKDAKIGFLGGMDVPLIRKFHGGYLAGAMFTNPKLRDECRLLGQYAGKDPQAFNDPKTGESIGRSMYSQGAEIVYHAAGWTGSGLFKAARDAGKTAIGVDSDQGLIYMTSADAEQKEIGRCILTSMLKRVDRAVFLTAKQFIEQGKVAGGYRAFSLADDGVGYAVNDFNRDRLAPYTAQLEQIKKRIIAGEIAVPDSLEKALDRWPQSRKFVVPSASIRIDGKFDDWEGVQPALVDHVGDQVGPDRSLDIERVYLAKDAQYIYVRFDISDRTPASFLRPYNFEWRQDATYTVFVTFPQSRYVQLTVTSAKGKWLVRIGKGETVSGKWALVAELGESSHAKAGSSLEARFPLSDLSGLIEPGLCYPAGGQTGTQDGGTWRQADIAETMSVQF